jgi:hypothetical protein
MMIKILLIAATVVFAALVLRDSTGKLLAVRRLVGLGFVFAAIAAVLFPDALTWVANLVGVHRGTDLLLYGSIVVFLFTTFAAYQRIHHLEGQITLLARELALRTTPADASTLVATDAVGVPGSVTDSP